jgi:hypothetical protein
LYHPYGTGCILGLDPDIKIDRNLSDQSSYTLMYPRNKQPVKVIDPLELDEPLEHSEGDQSSEKHKSNTARGSDSQSTEMDFVPLPFRKNRDDGSNTPIITRRSSAFYSSGFFDTPEN